MTISKREKLLIDGLKICGVSKGVAAAIFMTLQTDEQMLEMCKYLAEHRTASGEELLGVARIISAATQEE